MAITKEQEELLTAVLKLPAGERFELLYKVVQESRITVTITLEMVGDEFTESIIFQTAEEKAAENHG